MNCDNSHQRPFGFHIRRNPVRFGYYSHILKVCAVGWDNGLYAVAYNLAHPWLFPYNVKLFLGFPAFEPVHSLVICFSALWCHRVVDEAFGRGVVCDDRCFWAVGVPSQ